MRMLIGMIVGAFLTIAGAYFHDHTRGDPRRPIVNWDVAEADWIAAKTWIRSVWSDLAGR